MTLDLPSLQVTPLAALAFLPGVHNASAADGFDVVVLGGLGGIQDGNLTSFRKELTVCRADQHPPSRERRVPVVTGQKEVV